MCGRAAQTRRAVRAAEDLFLGHASSNNRETTGTSHQQKAFAQQRDESEWQDNYNMSPGMSCAIFFQDDTKNIQMDRKVWGLVPKGGTSNNPLPTGMSLHFSNLMFNARSDTLLDKRSFVPLLGQGCTCVVVVDGFFEWKPAALKGGKKQPYYVYRNKNDEARPYLMFAGLWTSVPTGREDKPTLDTFTIITTEACPALTWLHSRMPLAIYDESLAREWLQRPSRQLFKQVDEAVTPPDYFQWHPVTTEMNSMKYRSQDAVKAVPPPVSVKSFFTTLKKSDCDASSPAKRTPTNSQSANDPSEVVKGIASSAEKELSPSLLKRSPASKAASSSPAKKRKAVTTAKKGPIESFFSPKPKK